jgi:hypothetical protein
VNNITILSILFISAGLLYSQPLPATCSSKASEFFISGPSITKHFWPYPINANDFHLGIGTEFYFYRKSWNYGLNAHWMINDSVNQPAYWAGLTGGYVWGNQKKFWLNPLILIGLIKKGEYNQGKFSPFGLPLLAVGYHRLGLNIAYIPKIPHITYPILIIQVKYRLTSAK